MRRRFRIEGHVQGVGFRYWTLTRVADLPLHGFVRNLADGAVEVEAAGEEAALDRLESLLRRGPDHARVEAVRRLPPGDHPLPDGFELRR